MKGRYLNKIQYIYKGTSGEILTIVIFTPLESLNHI